MEYENTTIPFPSSYSTHDLLFFGSKGTLTRDALPEATWPYVIGAIVAAAVWVVGSTANGITIVTFLRRRELFLHQPVFLLLFNLSIVDFLICFLGTPHMFVSAIKNSWAFSQEVCYAYAFGMSVVGITNSTTTAVIAMERYRIMKQSITSPVRTNNRPYLGLSSLSSSSSNSSTGSLSKSGSTFRNRNLMPSLEMILVVVFIWLYAVGISLGPLLGWSGYIVEGVGFSCAPRWNTVRGGWPTLSYSIFLLFFGFCVPGVAIVVSYTLLMRHVKSCSMSSAATCTQRICRLKALVALMIAAFLSTWLPYATFSTVVMLGYEDYIPRWLGSLPVIWCKLSVAVNPFVYFLTVTNLRSAMRKTLKKLFCRRKKRHSGHSSRRRLNKNMSSALTSSERKLRTPVGCSTTATTTFSNSSGRNSSSLVHSPEKNSPNSAADAKILDDGGVWWGGEYVDVKEVAETNIDSANVVKDSQRKKFSITYL